MFRQILTGVVGVGSWAALSAQAVVLNLEQVVAGLDSPVYATAAPGDPDRLFIVERGGDIEILDLTTGTLAPQPFLTVGNLETGGEGGLLGLVFDPGFAGNGRFYVNFTEQVPPGSGVATVSRIQGYTVSADPDLADAASVTPVISYQQPQLNHNAGWIGFGPDGYLYIPTGDGGGGNDDDAGHTPGIGNAQDLTDNLLGKVLRLDVNGDDFADPERNYAIPADNPFVGATGDDEIWAYGLRNPFRASFDRLSGDFYIGDVGQNFREEIDFQPADSDGGENYGWRLREGTIATPTPEDDPVGGPRPADNVDPIYDYAHGSGPLQGNAVTGGYVYRGSIPQLQGLYFFADFINDRLWSLRFDGSDPTSFDGSNFTDFTDWTDAVQTSAGSLDLIVSFAEDGQGNLYIVGLDGEIHRFAAVIPVPGTLALLALGLWGAVRYRPRRA